MQSEAIDTADNFFFLFHILTSVSDFACVIFLHILTVTLTNLLLTEMPLIREKHHLQKKLFP